MADRETWVITQIINRDDIMVYLVWSPRVKNGADQSMIDPESSEGRDGGYEVENTDKLK